MVEDGFSQCGRNNRAQTEIGDSRKGFRFDSQAGAKAFGSVGKDGDERDGEVRGRAGQRRFSLKKPR
jgi:hypothetical protein